MKEVQVALIANPHAGRGGTKREQDVERFTARLKDHQISVEVQYTRSAGDATRIAAELSHHQKFNTIIASGGDGTINETLQGLIGSKTRLAVWPAGTANVLAREIKMPAHPERAADVIARANARRIHLGIATEEASGTQRYFFLMAGIGLDASVVQRVRPQLKRRLGEAAFWYSGLEHLATWEPEFFTLEIDGETFPATFAAIGKSARYGGNLAITPRAKLEEPLFEVCIVNSQSRLRYLQLLADLMRGANAQDTDDVLFKQTTQVRALGRAAVQADGELIGQLPMTFAIAPETVELITP